jgi:hypothetical protein
MKNNPIKNFFGIVSLLCVLNALVLFVWPAAVWAQQKAPQISTSSRCDNYKAQFNLTSKDNPKATSSIIGDIPVYCSAADLLIPLINYSLGIAGTVTVLFLIVGGFWYLTSAGNEEQTEKGKKTLLNSVIGLVVIILAYTIVRVVSSTLTLGK